jgi:hypothetical protein
VAQQGAWYGAGQIDDTDNGYYLAFYESTTMRGGGVSATWLGNSGLFAALPTYYSGPDAATSEAIRNTPIPDFPAQTRILVTNMRTGRQVIVPLAGRGPALWTGAAISLSLDAKRALGFADGVEGYVFYQILRN